MVKKRSTVRIGYALIAATLILMISVIAFAMYVYRQDFGTITIEFPKTGTLLIENRFTVFGNDYGKIINLHNKPSGTAVATIKLNKPLVVHSGYKAYVYDVGLFGKRAICLENGPTNAPRVNTKHALKGIYYPGISDILGSMYKVDRAFDELQKLVQRAYGDDPQQAKLVAAINNIKSKTDHITRTTTVFFEKSGIDLASAIPALNNEIHKGSTLLSKAKESVKTLDTFDQTALADAFKLLESANKLDSLLSHYAQVTEAELDSLDRINLDFIPQKLMDIESQFSKIVSDAHKLKLRIKRYNSED